MAHAPECYCPVCSAVRSAVHEEVEAKAKAKSVAKSAVADLDLTEQVATAIDGATRERGGPTGQKSREEESALPPRQPLPNGATSNMK